MPFVGNFGPTELIIILVIALLVIGPGKLPEVGSALGRSIREFRKAASDVKDAASVEPTPPAEATQSATPPAAAPPPAAVVAPPPVVTAPSAPPSGDGPTAAAPVSAEPVAAAPAASDTDAPAS